MDLKSVSVIKGCLTRRVLLQNIITDIFSRGNIRPLMFVVYLLPVGFVYIFTWNWICTLQQQKIIFEVSYVQIYKARFFLWNLLQIFDSHQNGIITLYFFLNRCHVRQCLIYQNQSLLCLQMEN